ncbi:universal stress protein [Leptolyngbya sp. NIES-2104]|uniref:universal stress protein n=1 Tax=Leptolyngbya sp. NIES-2104 TaxID=1552121 RepID=UPI0006ECBD27|nr:universal stress protein [Leptolyngbya sp. NIES-2104]GAP94478.1 universal stress protein UspA and related nucleotide-binding protein [Leptolyngbya sp. NIES-2104]
MFQRILVALDRAETNQSVFEKAIELAKTNQAKVMLLHAISPIDEGISTPMYPMVDSLYPIQHEAFMRSSAQLFSQAETAGLDMLRAKDARALTSGVCCEFTQHVGDPGDIICTIAKTWNADLVVMGRRGRSGLSEFLLGSVSNYVMHHAPCSVLIVQEALVGATI